MIAGGRSGKENGSQFGAPQPLELLPLSRDSFCVSPVEEQWPARGHGRSPAARTHGQAAQHRLHRAGDHHHRALHFTQRQR